MNEKVRDLLFYFVMGACFGMSTATIVTMAGPLRYKGDRIRELEYQLEDAQRAVVNTNNRAAELNQEMGIILSRNAGTIGEIREIIQSLRECIDTYSIDSGRSDRTDSGLED